MANKTPDSTYGTAEFAAASRGIILVGPLAGAFAALRTAQIRSYLARSNSSRLSAYLRPLWPIFALPPAAGVLGMISSSRRLPTTPDALSIVVVYFITVLACALLGALLAAALPVVVAVPVIGLGAFAWLSLPAASGNVALRQVNSSLVGCCTMSQQPASVLFAASITLTLTVAVGCGISLCIVRRRTTAWIAVLGTLVAAATASAVVVHTSDDLNLMAVEPRHDDTVCDVGADLSVCVWPEHRTQLPNAKAVYSKALGELAAAGVRTPRRLSEQAGRNVIAIDVPPGASDDNLVVSLAVGLLPNPQGCERASGVFTAYDNSLVWLAHTMGASDATVRQIVAEPDVALAITARPATEQTRWFLTRYEQLQSACASS